MTTKLAAPQVRPSVCRNAAWLALIGAALGVGCMAAAQSPAPPSILAPQALEWQFWLCDYAATRRLLDAGSAAECSAASEELRRGRFRGNFTDMLAWWRNGRAAAHRAVVAAQHATTVTPVSGLVPPVDGLRGRLEALTAPQVKLVYLNCSSQALERRLDGGEAAMCSIAYDVLLRRHFGGDFSALLAWSRQQGRLVQPSQAARAERQPEESRRMEQRGP